MKKVYVKPSVEVIKMNVTCNILAGSLKINNEETINTSVDGEQLGREDRPSSGSIWNSAW